MAKDFDTTCRSPYMAFIESPVGQARGCLEVITGLGYGYTVCGQSFSSTLTDFDRYDGDLDSWAALSNVPFLGVLEAAAWSRPDLGRGYLAGGTSNSTTATSGVVYYNQDAAAWVTAASLPTGRSEHGAAVVGDDAFVVCGIDIGVNPLKSCDRYRGEAWANVADAPNPSRTHPAVTAADGYVLTFGGIFSTSPFSDNDRYDPVANSWSSGVSCPLPARYEGAAEPLGLEGFYWGGNDYSVFSSDTDSYAPSTNSWTARASLPTTVAGHASFALDPVLCSYFGVVVGSPFQVFHRYESGAWSVAATPLSPNRTNNAGFNI